MKKFIRKTKVMKFLVVLLLSNLVLASCGSMDESMTSDTSVSKGMSNESMEAPEMDAGINDGDMLEFGDVAMENSDVTTVLQSDESLASLVDSRKYIRTYRYYMETLTFDETVAKLDGLVDANYGFYQSSETSGRAYNASDYQRRSGSYVVRIPKEKVEAFTNGIEGIGHILDKNNFVDDVTSQYLDIDARIKTLRIQEERLLAILEEADDLQYIIELERELSDVTYEIEKYTTSFKDLENQINYSTIYIELNEVFEETVIVKEPLTFFEEMKDGFSQSVDSVVNFLKELVLFLTTNIPVFIILAMIGFILYKVIKRLIRPKKRVMSKPLPPMDKVAQKNEENVDNEPMNDNNKS